LLLKAIHWTVELNGVHGGVKNHLSSSPITPPVLLTRPPSSPRTFLCSTQPIFMSAVLRTFRVFILVASDVRGKFRRHHGNHKRAGKKVVFSVETSYGGHMSPTGLPMLLYFFHLCSLLNGESKITPLSLCSPPHLLSGADVHGGAGRGPGGHPDVAHLPGDALQVLQD